MSGLLAQRQAFAKLMLHQVFESLLGFLNFLPEHCIPHIYIPLKETGVDMSMYHIHAPDIVRTSTAKALEGTKVLKADFARGCLQNHLGNAALDIAQTFKAQVTIRQM